jgi:hypothetical protein
MNLKSEYKKMKYSKATGLDGIPAEIWRYVAARRGRG